MSEEYDCGCLSGYGGGNISWWQDYIRSEVRRANDFNASTIESLESEVAALKEENEAFGQERKDLIYELHRLALVEQSLKARVAELETENERLQNYYDNKPN